MNGIGKELDKIKRRQTAKFLWYLESTNQITPQIRKDFLHIMKWIFSKDESFMSGFLRCMTWVRWDVDKVISENKEDQPPIRLNDDY